jgi:hypothetical protein
LGLILGLSGVRGLPPLCYIWAQKGGGPRILKLCTLHMTSERLGDKVEGDFADVCARHFSLVLMGERAYSSSVRRWEGFKFLDPTSSLDCNEV